MSDFPDLHTWPDKVPKVWMLRIRHQIVDGLTGELVTTRTISWGPTEEAARARFSRRYPGAINPTFEVLTGPTRHYEPAGNYGKIRQRGIGYHPVIETAHPMVDRIKIRKIA